MVDGHGVATTDVAYRGKVLPVYSLDKSFPQVGSAQVGSAQVGSAQVGFAQVGFAQVGFAQVGSAQVGTFATFFVKPPFAVYR
ncbi:hypothetical protein D3C74_472770 [compost metagenome]